MFLSQINKRNPSLLNAAIHLKQLGDIAPDTYVLDLNAIEENAVSMIMEAKKYGMKLYFMLKQIGRNPLVAKRLMNLGFGGVVCVDVREAETMHAAGIKIGHVGHLVQIPSDQVAKVVAMRPEYITVYTVEKAREINEACQQQGIKQKLIIRVIGENDFLYPSQYGGFLFSELDEAIPALLSLDHVEIAGLTSFPCFLYDKDQHDIVATHNVETMERAAARLKKDYAIDNLEWNMPSATCTRTIAKIVAAGGTQGEPGHGLTGTTPMHAYEQLEEKPAYVYVSEIAHHIGDKSYCYGGGYYRRSGMANAIVVKEEGKEYTKVRTPDMPSIDYHFELNGSFPVGATVVMAFRTQIFVTRSHVAVVDGIQTGAPKLLGIFDSQGKQIRG